MKAALIVCIVVLCHDCVAQTFNNLYDISGINYTDEGRSLEVFGGDIYAITAYNDFVVSRINGNTGEIVDQLVEDIYTYVGWRAGSTMDADGNIYVAGSDYNGKARIVKVSSDLELLYVKSYYLLEDTTFSLINHCAQVYGDKLYVGLNASYLDSAQFNEGDEFFGHPGFSVMDLDGNLLEGPYFHHTPFSHDLIFHIHVNEEGVYLGGVNRKVDEPDDDDPFIVKFNFEGESVWHTEIEDDGTEFENTNYQAALTSDLEGNIYVGSFLNPDIGDSGGMPLVGKFTSAGDFLWSKWFGYYGAFYYCRFNEIFFDDGFIYGVGATADSQIQIEGMLMKLSLDGDSIWKRRYHLLGDEEWFQFTDVKRMDDGGFACIGFHLPDGGVDLDTWVVRTDSLGCVIPGCDTGVQEWSDETGELMLYPNPASDIVNIELRHPASRNEPTELTILDVQGRVVESHTLFSPGITNMLIVKDLPAGHYVVCCVNEKGRWREKLVVE